VPAGDTLPDRSMWPQWLQEAYADRSERMLRSVGIAPGLAAAFSDDEWRQRNAHPIRRGEDELDALRVGAGRQTYPAYRDAATDALAWVQGERRAAPISGYEPVGPRPMLLEIAHEIRAADKAGEFRGVHTEAEADRCEYALKVRDTLRWILRALPLPPLHDMPPLRLHPPVQLPDPSAWPGTFAEDVAHRGRLDSEGHAVRAISLYLSDEDWSVLNVHPLVRTAAEITAVQAEAQSAASEDFCQGILAAIAWALGERGPAPWTERVPVGDRPTWTEIAAEITATEDNLARGPAARHRPNYAVGIEHTLMWLLGDTEDPPIGHPA
jgi:hypothetical protein